MEVVMEFYFERLDVHDGGRIKLPEGVVSIGRGPKNTVVLSVDNRCVSGLHVVIYVDPRRLLLQDMQSTNGTFVNNRRVQECVLEAGDEVRLGRSGPRFKLVADGEVAEAGGFDFNGGLSGVSIRQGSSDTCDNIAEDEYHKAIEYVDSVMPGFKADEKTGVYGSVIPSENPRKKSPAGIIIAISAIAVAGLLSTLFILMSTPSSPPEKSPSNKKDFFTPPAGEPSSSTPPSPSTQFSSSSTTTDRIHSVLARFGETDDYRAPPEMVERVEHYLNLYTSSMRRTIAAYMKRSEQYFPMIRSIFAEKNIPLELAYVSMLESGFNTAAVSHAGAVGLWQFMPHTGRRYGLEVSSRVDERTDPEKSTYAAAAFFKHLIAIFGSKSSVMLCMAAYNAGEQRIINALKRIDDPMKDRDFWYLYRMGWLAEETNEYIPQVIALIIISENLEEYGF
jgi:hypothetical protein